MKSIKVCEYTGSMSFHDDLMFQDQASGDRYQDQWSFHCFISLNSLKISKLCFVARDKQISFFLKMYSHTFLVSHGFKRKRRRSITGPPGPDSHCIMVGVLK